MAARIEDYALIGDCETAALVSRDGSIDWLCLPRFDSDACFAALLGDRDHGSWRLAPAIECQEVHRQYRDDTLILETHYKSPHGSAVVTDFMPARDGAPNLVRIVEGRGGELPMRMQLAVRFGYGSIVPWVQHAGHGIRAIGGPDAVVLQSSVKTRGEGLTTVADFVIRRGEQKAFTLTWFPSHQPPPRRKSAAALLKQTEAWWREWSGRATYRGPYRRAVMRSLVTLKALTFAPTGGIVAAPTTSLPEQLGGTRNWDYRFCWVRDATMTLLALLSAGYLEEAAAWREWLLRAVAGSPSELQIAYGVRGERRLTELTLDWLPGYEHSRPVRIGNAASEQFQLDVYGELLDTMHQCRAHGLPPEPAARHLECAVVNFVAQAWDRPDEGIWEIRGPRRHFTHSRVMAWVAIDRAILDIERFGVEGPLDRWKALRTQIHDDVCRHGFHERLNSFVQYYGSTELDASLLMIPLVGFLPASDPRVKGTVRAIEERLRVDGFLLRYAASNAVDGLPPGEGVFLPCSFWLADNYVLAERREEATALYERLLGLCNDVGLLSEEYDPHARRLLGNFPQALSHIALIDTATNLARRAGAARQRSER